MAPLTVISWNVRGLNSMIKGTLVFKFLKQYSPDICILQETHLVGDRVLSLRKPWVGHYYHATHSTHARGVSILICKSLLFTLRDLHLDPKGKYVVLPVSVDGMPLILVGLYNPPPAFFGLLTKITQILASHSVPAVILARDFNMVPCPNMDKLSPDPATDSPLSRCATTLGLTDVWRWKYPRTRGYTCSSATYTAMSRIDLIYLSSPVLFRVQEISALPRGISNHTPILLKLHTRVAPGDYLWCLSRYWVSDECVEPVVELAITVYWATDSTGTETPAR